MDCFGPVLKSPRIIRSDRLVHGRTGSVTPTPHLASRRSSSALPRSRSSFGCVVSDVGRDGSLVTRQIATDPSHRKFLNRVSLYSSPQSTRACAGRERSFSIGSTSPNWTRPDSWSRFTSIRNQTSYLKRGSTPHLSRRDSYNQPYYTISSGGSSNRGAILKRTSVYGSQSPLGTIPRRSFSTASYLLPGQKVVAESNAVSRRTSIQGGILNDVPISGQRFSVRRSTTPSTDHRQYFLKRSSVNQPMLQSGKGNPSSGSYTSRYSSLVFPASQRSSISSLPPTHVRKISVMAKPKTENEPKSSIEVVELENIPPMMKTVTNETLAMDDKFQHRQELLEVLKKRTAEAKNRLCKHRMLLDRYLPIKLGPEPEVAFEIQNKYGELVERLPFIEKRIVAAELEKENEIKDEWSIKVRPYSPAAPVKSYTSTLYGVHVPSSFTPTISETRKRARDVLCRVKGDPNYFNYNV